MHTLTTKYNQEKSPQMSMIKTLHNTMVDSPKVYGQHEATTSTPMAAKREYSKKLRNIVFSYQPIFYLSRIFGLLPFSLTYDSNGEIKSPKINKFDGVWFIISITVCLAFAKVVSSSIEIPKGTTPPILILGSQLLLMFGLIFGAIIIVENMCSRFKFVKILKMFIAFDKEASE